MVNKYITDKIMNSDGWIGIGFYGCLCEPMKYAVLNLPDPSKVDPGEVCLTMIEFVNQLLALGKEVKIVSPLITAVYDMDYLSYTEKVKEPIDNFCRIHFGMVLPLTCTIDSDMALLISDNVYNTEDVFYSTSSLKGLDVEDVETDLEFGRDW